LIWFDYLKLIRRPAIYLIIYDHGDVVMFYLSIFCYRFCYTHRVADCLYVLY